MLPILLQAPAIPPDAFDVLVKIGAWALGGLIIAVLGWYVKENADLKRDIRAIDKHHGELLHALDIEQERFRGFAKWATAEIEWGKANVLTKDFEKLFKYATRSQNTVLNAQSDSLEEIKDRAAELERKVSEIDRTRPTRSEANFPAARAPYPPPHRTKRVAPIPRTDGPSEYPESDVTPSVPLMRAELPSRIT